MNLDPEFVFDFGFGQGISIGDRSRLFPSKRLRRAARRDLEKNLRREALLRHVSQEEVRQAVSLGRLPLERRRAAPPLGPNSVDIFPYIPGSTTPKGVLGSNLVRWLKNYSTGATATWTCAVGSGNATQSTAANQPTLGTGSFGQSYPVFNGAASPNNPFLNINGISSLPAYSTSNQYIYSVIINISAVDPVAGFCAWVYNTTTYETMVTTNVFDVAGSQSNSSGVTGTTFVLVVNRNSSGGVTTMYVNDVAQSTTGSGVAGRLGTDWKTAGQSLGGRTTGDYRMTGFMSSMVYGFQSGGSAFSRGVISSLYAAQSAMI